MGPAHLAWMWVGSRDEVLISARFRRRALCNDAKNFRNELLVSAKKIGASQAYAWCIFALTRTQSHRQQSRQRALCNRRRKTSN